MKIDIRNNTSLITKIAGGVLAILGLALLGIDYATSQDDTIQLSDDDISVSDKEPIRKNNN